MPTVVKAATPVVATVKLAEVAPGATVTVAGTVAEATLDERLTATPLGPAAAPKVTVPVAVEPP